MARNSEEASIQRSLFDHIRLRGKPELVAWCVPNGAYMGPRGFIIASKLKAQGMRPGVSDVNAVLWGQFYALEIKAIGGKPTEAQRKYIDDVNNAGGFAAWGEGLDRCLRIAECWGWFK